MRYTLQTLLVAPLLLAVTLGSTDCDSYSTVTVPDSDTTAPLTFDGVFDQATNTWLTLGDSGTTGIVHHLTPDKLVSVVASGLDRGGTHLVSMASQTRWQCCQGNQCTTRIKPAAPIVDTQDGSVGDDVSDGLYTGTIIGTLPKCDPGATLTFYRFTWFTTVEDFHGNRRVSAQNQAVYPLITACTGWSQSNRRSPRDKGCTRNQPTKIGCVTRTQDC